MDWLRTAGRIPKYVSNLGVYLSRSRSLVWGVASVLLILVLWMISSCLERYVRMLGMAFQLIGIILVGIGLRDTRRAFEDQPTTLEAIKRWWAGRPRLKPKNVTLEVESAAMGVSGMSARARISASPNAPLKHRVAVLEREHATLFDEVGKLSDETKQKIGELSNAISLERREREAADKGIKQQLEKAVAGGLPLGRLGAVCFFIGIIATSLSPEFGACH